ncbi:peptidylprolyl isomerase [Nitrosomonas sp. JL21]|uniref:FKBP-type peptidyl-prolyl cis-trans isomerase n=1 Tax=Nitrosomonas sp. JL21 TaxID=153949 RepID=UPI001368EC78|nr:peptidylprolyl isomerase [Nitrosomonas sp. JL21]MBL8496644.1 peptidylprolyl isomerase [Nitrosomonas sp.]MXS76442.1 peptidylprolyl isomerase [Nitrosomonas sp. JL21]
MRIKKNTVVSINYELTDATGNVLEKTEMPISYLHGGYGGIFPMIEEALHDMEIGFSCSVSMEPEDTFGEYDAELIRVEPRSSFPENVTAGMHFEGGVEGSNDVVIYKVTDVTDDSVIVDGNHPFAGMKLTFACTVTDVRIATPEEISHQHVHGAHGHEH